MVTLPHGILERQEWKELRNGEIKFKKSFVRAPLFIFIF